MDIKVSSQRTSKFSYYVVAIIVLLGLVMAIKQVWQYGRSEVMISASELVMSKVQKGSFTVSVRGNGTLVPDQIEWLSAGGDAKVAQQFFKAGNHVKKGDLIVLLSNPRLEQSLVESKWEYSAIEAQLMAEKVNDSSRIKQLKSTILRDKLALQGAQHEYQAHQELIVTGAVSKLDFQRAKITVDQAKQRYLAAKQLLDETLKTHKANQQARFARLNQIKNQVSQIQSQVDDLQIKATMDSIVLDVPIEVGKHVTTGSNIVKLANHKALIGEIQVPEIQIQQVKIGQTVRINTQNSQFTGSVSRINPAVVQGNVQVDVAFHQPLPADARPDLSVEANIQVAKLNNTLFVSRPLFSQSQTATSFYKVDPDAGLAHRVKVEVGLGSTSHVQIIKGLVEGDIIITSDPSRFDSYPTFSIN
jgi:multidrug efflux pump subunit AcrA (membrane-fusion protein)